ncbi:Collagen triple helix repeat (20 copies) [Bacillus sp. THAF10]|uniref:exosporium glycoprotein BclB-related protein n=1 Tax=Bacillus sp. THAF10 TaxID=2587848 RepID=UPI00126846A7|nr:exosporium glycoprotein BclB-related protein [Bacillus sp. THAF10]QFT90354.1 Collagen triple helix repeat (20 copies) [Bacillus sp. THAF10]
MGFYSECYNKRNLPTTINITCTSTSDGSGGGTVGPQGPQGPQGEVGPQGPQGEVGPQGPTGADGADGAQGPQGAQGPAGADGVDGTDGLDGTSAIIPYASGGPVELVTVLGDTINTVGLLGFGFSETADVVAGEPINISDSGGVSNFAFPLPRDITITGISGFFSVSLGATLVEPVTITATIYAAPPGSNDFTETAASVDLGEPLVGVLTAGETRAATLNDVSVDIEAGSRLLLVYSSDAEGLASAVTGFASGAITIN